MGAISPPAAGSAACAPPRRSAISGPGRSRISASLRGRRGCYEVENRGLDRGCACFDFAQHEEIICVPFPAHLMLSEVEARTLLAAGQGCCHIAVHNFVTI